MTTAAPQVHEEELTARASDRSQLPGRMWTLAERSDVVVLLTHGVASAHDSGMGTWFGREMASRGWSVAAFDRRDARTVGGDLTFTDGLDDVAAAVDAVSGAGFERVVLCGHSKGTLFVPHYAATRSDGRVVAIGLFGLVHDNREAAREMLMGENYDSNVAAARAALDAGDSQPVPLKMLGGPLLEMAPEAFLGFFGPDADAVPLEWITKVSLPAYACVASTDALTPRHFHETLVEAALGAGVDIHSEVIEDPEAGRDAAEAHRFIGLEAQAAEPFNQWLTTQIDRERA